MVPKVGCWPNMTTYSSLGYGGLVGDSPREGILLLGADKYLGKGQRANSSELCVGVCCWNPITLRGDVTTLHY